MQGGARLELWQEAKREHDQKVLEGHKANNAGSAQGAMENFEAAVRAMPKVSTLLSAVNMRFKMSNNEKHRAVCVCAYNCLLQMQLQPKEADIVRKKQAECSDAMQPELKAALQATLDEPLIIKCRAFERLAGEAVTALQASPSPPSPTNDRLAQCHAPLARRAARPSQ